MNKQILIKKGDITKLRVDAIVNAAHNSLMGGGGVDGAIHRAAGSQLLTECMQIKEDKNGIRCKDGDAYITKGYQLPSKYVIHTVAPKFVGSLTRNNGEIIFHCSNGSLEENNNTLSQCYKNCMKLAEENKLESIAFPSLGTGGHAYPIEIACPIAIKIVKEFFQTTQYIKCVIFVCFSDNDYSFYQNQFELTKKQIFK